MSIDLYQGIIGRLAAGCTGMNHAYFNQGEANSDHIKNSLEILGDFQDKEKNPYDGGICFGLSALYLGCNTPAGRRQWSTQRAIMKELKNGVCLAGNAPGMLRAVAEAFVKQKKATVIDRSMVGNPQSLAAKTKAFEVRKTAYEATLLNHQANQGAANEKTAIRDQLMANFSLKASPRGGNSRTFSCQLGGDFMKDYEPRFSNASIGPLVDYVGKRNTFSLISYEIPFVGGHQMAALGHRHGVHFFDPNYGTVYTTFAAGMKTFMARAIPFFYLWKGNKEGKRSSRDFMSGNRIPNKYWSKTALDLEVYRYEPA